MRAYALYNEIDNYAADWLENLIRAGQIAPGIVDRRSIEDLLVDDLRGFRQVHFFAGIGVWSYALRRAGISDDTALWTGSCPCQPFSAAGKGGGVDDERHLWPSWHHLIRQYRPERILGEQVASKDGLGWLDTVSADLEAEGYTFGVVDTCSAGSGAPHIRQRLRFVAYNRRSSSVGLEHATRVGRKQWRAEPSRWSSVSGCRTGRLGDDHHTRLEGFGSRHQAALRRLGSLRPAAEAGEFDGLADSALIGCYVRTGLCGSEPRECRRDESADNRSTSGMADLYEHGCDQTGEHQPSTGNDGLVGDGAPIGLANTAGRSVRNEREQSGWQHGLPEESGGTVREGLSGAQSRASGKLERPGPTNGFWRDADWLFCRDGKWRPIEPGTFPLAHGAAARVGRLRAYGNAVDAEATTDFIEACLEHDTIEGEIIEGRPAFDLDDGSLTELLSLIT